MNPNLIYICDKNNTDSTDSKTLGIRGVNKPFKNLYKQSSTKFPSIQKELNKYEIIINDINIGSLNFFILDILLPEIGGVNEVSYCKYFGYKLIKNIMFSLDDEEIYQLDTMSILSNVLSNNNSKHILELAGETPFFRNLKKGVKSYDVLIPESNISVYIPTCFDSYLRYGSSTSLIKDYKKLTITIEFNDLMDCINYVNDLTFEELKIKKVELLATVFNKISKKEKDYIEKIKSYEFNICDSNIIIPFNNFNKIKWFFTYNNRDLLYYPKEYIDEKDFLFKFEKYIAKNTFVIVPKDTTTNIDENILVPIIKNKIELDNGRSISVYIDNIPSTHKLYFNKEVLSFKNKRLNYFLNFSEKFDKVQGRYSTSQNKIIFEKIKSFFTPDDISIPLSKWQSDINDSGVDRRVKKKKYTINDINIGGKDIFGNVSPVMFTKIRLGNRNIFESDNNVEINNISSTDNWNKINKLEIIPFQHNAIFKTIKPIEEEDIRNIHFDLTLPKTPEVLKTDIKLHILLYSIDTI